MRIYKFKQITTSKSYHDLNTQRMPEEKYEQNNCKKKN